MSRSLYLPSGFLWDHSSTIVPLEMLSLIRRVTRVVPCDKTKPANYYFIFKILMPTSPFISAHFYIYFEIFHF